MTYRQAAISFLKERGPMHYRDLADAIMTAGAVQARGATPAATLNPPLRWTSSGRGRAVSSFGSVQACSACDDCMHLPPRSWPCRPTRMKRR